jgi:hypothetical protein
MKKTRLLIALLVMLVAASGYAQDSYREAVKEYMAVNSQEALNNYWNRMDSVLKANNTYWFESGDVDLNQLTERYFKEGIMDYMTDFMCAKTKELGVTEAGLREYRSLMSTPEGQTYKEHMAQWVEAIKRDTTVLNGQDSQDSLKIMAGEYPDPIQVKAGIDPGYVEKYNKVLGADMAKYTQGMFDQYFNIFTMMFEGMSDEMKDAMSDEMKDMQKRFDGMKNWMTANIPTIALNNAYGIFTEDDLDFVAKTQTLDTRKLIGLLPMNPGDMMSMGIGVMKDYLEWMEDHGAVMKEGMKEFLQNFQLFNPKLGD